MRSLASELLGESRAAILAVLLRRPDQAIHVRELARITGVSPGTLHRELKALEALGILTRIQTGRQVSYGANRGCPIYDELASLLRKTDGLVDVLRDALAPLKARLDRAFVYGSMASGDIHPHSDIDVMLVGEVDFADAVIALAPAQAALRREVNPTVLRPREFERKRRQPEAFVARIWAEPKLWLIGGPDEPG